MNSSQAASLVRFLLNFISGAFLAWSASHAKPAQDVAAFAAQFLNGPDILALCTAGVMWLWGHVTHSSSPPTNSGGGSTGGALGLMVFLCAASFYFLCAVGCTTTPQQATYQVAGTVSVSAAEAVRAYDVFAAAGKTTVAQNLQVKAAYEKYQAAFLVVCDVGAAYAATAGTTNGAGATGAALATAEANAGNELTDLLNLVRSFGVKI